MIIIYSVLILITFILLIFTFYNFPWMTKYWYLDAEKFVIRRGNRVAFISDVHMGAKDSSVSIARAAIEKLKRLGVNIIVIVGDLIDERIYVDVKGLERLAIAITDILSLKDVTAIYISSNSAHDIALRSHKDKSVKISITDGAIDFIYIQHALDVEFEGCRDHIYATHGDYISRNGVVSYLIDRIGRSILKRPLTGVIARRVLNLDHRFWIVLGHSHVHYIDHRNKIINLGNWVKRYYAPRESAIAIATCVNGQLKVSLASVR